MFDLALKTVRYRKGSFVATFLGMFLCALMLIAAGGVVETGLRYTVPAQRLADSSVVVTGDGTYVLDTNPVGSLSERVQIDRDLVDSLGAIPGVDSAVPDVSFHATMLRDGAPVDTETWGRAWTSAVLNPYTITDGAAPARPGQIAVDPTTAQEAGLVVGSTVTAAAHGGTADYLVTGIATPSTATTEKSMFFTDADVAVLSRNPATVDSVALVTAPGVDVAAVARAATAIVAGTPTVVLTGDDRGIAEFPASLEVDDLLLVGFIFVLLSLVAGLLGVASTMSLAFQNREREIALMRAIGATPRQVRRMILGETLVVSLLATALAVAPGIMLGEFLFKFIVLVGVAPEELTFKHGWIPTAVAVGLAVCAALGAGSIAGRRAVRTRPTAAIAATETVAAKRTGWVRRVLAILCFFQSGFLVFVSLTLVTGPFIAGPANWATIFFAIGLLLIGRDVTRGLVALLTPVLNHFRLPGQLAALNSRARVPQLAAIVGPILLLTAVATATSYVSSTEAASINIYTGSISGNVIIKSAPGGFSAEALAAVRATPGVGAASEFTTSAGFVVDPPDPRAGQDLQGWQLKGFTGDAAAQVGAATLSDGSFTDLTGNTVILNDVYATELGRAVGDTITMKMGDNTLEQVRIVGLMAERQSFATIILPAALLAEHTSEGLPDYVLATEAAGVDRNQLVTDLRGVVGSLPGAAIVDRDVLRASFEHHLGALELINNLFLAIMVGFITISIVNTLFLATGHRRREFALERLTGATRSQIIRMMTMEGLLASVIGIGLGTLIAPITLVSFSLARTGDPIPVGSPWIWVLVAGFALVLTVGATVAATSRALREKPLLAALPG